MLFKEKFASRKEQILRNIKAFPESQINNSNIYQL